MQRSHDTRRLFTDRRWVGGLAAWLFLACGSGPEGTPFSELTDEDERDGWVDTAHPLTGDGATSFDSYLRAALPGERTIVPWRPHFLDGSFDAGPLTRVVGGQLLSLSRVRGLVSTAVAGPGAPRVEASVPLSGLPVGFFVSGGVAAVLVVDPIQPRCSSDDCSRDQSSRVVLIDVQNPASPRALGEHRFEGTVSAAREVGGVLHVLSRQIVVCSNCAVGTSTELTWLRFDRASPLELSPPQVTPLPGSAWFTDERLLVLSEGAFSGDRPSSELRVAELTVPEPALSAPVPLGGPVGQALTTGDRLRVTYFGGAPDIETFALGAGTATSLGRGTLALPDGESLGRSFIDGDRAVAMLEPSGQLAVIDLSAANAPRLAAVLELGLSELNLAFAGGRVLAAGRSTLAADVPPDDDTIAHGPQALVLVDVADPAAARVLDRLTLGSFDAVQGSVLELRGDRALLSYYDRFPGSVAEAEPRAAGCGRANHRLMGYDVASGRLTPAFAFDGLDADSRIELLGDDWWVASSVSVSRYVASSSSATARAELTRSIQGVRALPDSVALFGVDFASNAPTLELATPSSPIESTQPLDVSLAAGLSRAGCDERRRWAYGVTERDGNVYALRFHLRGDGSPAGATLHVLDASLPDAAPRSLELEPLAAGEDYLGAVETDGALLIARGRRDAAPAEPGEAPRSLFSVSSASDPTIPSQEALGSVGSSSPWQSLHPDAQVSYDVVDLADPSAPVLASRLDITPALATGGFSPYRSAWGLRPDGLAVGPSVSGSILAGQHAEASGGERHRIYLDRIDLSDPSAPVQLEPIEIPGRVLDFDAGSGGLITLDTLLVREPAGPEGCDGVAPRDGQGGSCAVLRRALSGLMVDGARATRVGRLLLDDKERRVVRFAASNGSVYYVTQPLALTSEQGGPFAAREVTIERVALRDGRLERQASFDIAGSSSLSPEHWEQFAASGERVLWVAGTQLMVADFASGEPRLEVHEVGPWGCGALDVLGDAAYCAQGPAGYHTVTLGAP